MKKLVSAICAAFMLVGPGVATAATDSASFQVHTKVGGTCTVTTNGALDFGTYNGTAVSSFTSFSVSCTGAATDNYDVSAKLTSGNSWTVRDTGGNALNYSIFSDAGHANAWTDLTAANSNILSVTGGSSAQTFVYGEMAAGQSGPAGDYYDTVTVDISY
jgi:spore coat protein U-like protein